MLKNTCMKKCTLSQLGKVKSTELKTKFAVGTRVRKRWEQGTEILITTLLHLFGQL